MASACTVTPLLAGSCPAASPILLRKLSSSSTSSTRSTTAAAPLNNKMEEQLHYMLSQLSQDEFETAARASYEYLQNPGAEAPQVYAREMALRYLTSKKGDTQLALAKMKSTIAFRQEIDIDGLRTAFSDPMSDIAQPLEKFLASGKNYVGPYDKEGRATHVFVPRKTQKHHPKWTLKESLYTMERAIAASKADGGQVNAILDFNGFNPVYHAPPMSLGKDFVLTLRQHYAGQVHRIFIVDAPTGFSWLWKIFQPFLGKVTQDKIVFCSGAKQKRTVLGEFYAPEEGADWMLPGVGLKSRELDLQEYLYKTPFNKAFDA